MREFRGLDDGDDISNGGKIFVLQERLLSRGTKVVPDLLLSKRASILDSTRRVPSL